MTQIFDERINELQAQKRVILEIIEHNRYFGKDTSRLYQDIREIEEEIKEVESERRAYIYRVGYDW